MDPFPAGLTPPIAAFILTLLAALALRLYLQRWRVMQLVTVVDGDTYVAVDTRGTRRRLRLFAADCPEMGQTLGPQAKHFVHRTVGRRWVRVQLLGKDRYRRHVARVVVEGQDLAVMLVNEGLAYPLKAHWRLRLAAWNARWHRKGVHGAGTEPRPWHWRAKSRGRRFVAYWTSRLRRRKMRGRRG